MGNCCVEEIQSENELFDDDDNNHYNLPGLDTDTNKMLNKLKDKISESKLNSLEYYLRYESYEYVDIVSDLNEPTHQSLIFEFCSKELNDDTICDMMNDIISNAKSNNKQQMSMTYKNYLEKEQSPRQEHFKILYNVR